MLYINRMIKLETSKGTGRIFSFNFVLIMHVSFKVSFIGLSIAWKLLDEGSDKDLSTFVIQYRHTVHCLVYRFNDFQILFI